MNQWDADLYSGKHNFVFQYGEGLLPLLAAQTGERIIDLGCGTGELTAKIAATGAIVTGIDSSASMLEKARLSHPGITFVEADARTFQLPGPPYDAIFSNAVLHWIPEAALPAQRCFAHLRPGGRFIAEFGGYGNVAGVIQAVEAAAHTMGVAARHGWYYPSIATYATVLEQAGFEVDSAQLFDRFTRLDHPSEGLRHWLRMFGAALLAEVPAATLDQFFALCEQHARPRLYRDGHWHADYRRLRIVAHRPTSPA